jgi:phage shock protein C
MNRRLYRSRTDSVIGGVAGGVAEYLDIDPSIVRIVWAVLAIVTGGIFLVLYVVMWIVVPEGTPPPPADASAMPAADGAATDAPESTDTQAASTWSATAPDGGYAAQEPRPRGSGTPMIIGLVLVLLGVWFLIDQYVPALDSELLWPIALVVIGAALLFVSMRRSSDR